MPTFYHDLTVTGHEKHDFTATFITILQLDPLPGIGLTIACLQELGLGTGTHIEDAVVRKAYFRKPDPLNRNI